VHEAIGEDAIDIDADVLITGAAYGELGAKIIVADNAGQCLCRAQGVADQHHR
jgi:hypothetical protein